MGKSCLMVILVLAISFGVLCLEAWIGMVLFNWVVGLFGGALALTFWQAFGICALLSFVGGFFKTTIKSN